MTLPNAPLAFNNAESMPEQTADWTCSACSLAWMNRALGIQFATGEYDAADYIGVPDHINSLYGLMDASGTRLRDCLREQGAPAFCCWADWNDTFRMAQEWPLLIGGVNWYHWVGVRGTSGEYLWLANSAPGWGGVDQYMEEYQWLQLGPMAVVAIPLLTHFPPQTSA